MKKGIILVICLLAVNMAFSQTWSHTRGYLTKDGWQSEVLSDVKEIFVNSYENEKNQEIVTDFLYYNITDNGKGQYRYTPYCNCKLVEEGYATQVFKADTGEKTKVNLDWNSDMSLLSYIVLKYRNNKWVQTNSEFFMLKPRK